MKCPLCDICCVQKKQFTIDSTGIASDGDVRQYPAGQERLDRIEAVYQKYKHMGRVFGDSKTILFDDFERQIIFDLWRAIRREE